MYIHVMFDGDENGHHPPRFSVSDSPTRESGAISFPLAWFPHVQNAAPGILIYGFISSVENLIEGEAPILFTHPDNLVDYINEILKNTGAFIRKTGRADAKDGRYLIQGPMLSAQIKDVLRHGGSFSIICPDDVCYGHVVPFQLNHRYDTRDKSGVKDVDFIAF